ncbi:hypothetical protein KO506_02435 [Polaribacter vadi]|uniref:hypothetical protein n=1 Tax=Polaribacter TaxID=52959 RepID=UPI001C094FB4|nr:MULTISPECIES: hypothetical protein [Polaribacter]MBU3010250.1 hypothetical protein [Polaribacter vadi]MDO6740056.1 hypothetical protein [Polaribacter sp. 1_MG-2023]
MTTLLLSVWFRITYNKLKKIEQKKIELFHKEIQQENKQFNLLKDKSKKVELIEESILKKIKIIKVSLINIHFSLDEILN